MSNSLKTATYDSPLLATISKSLTSLNSSAEKARFRGPPGLKGKIVAVSGTITTSVTTAAAPITLGSGSDADAYLTSEIPVGVAPLGFQVSADDIEAGGAVDEIPADSDVLITAGGAAGAGAATVDILVAWYK